MSILLTTGQDLKQFTLSRIGDDATNPDFESEVESYLQSGYIAVLAAFPWLFGRKASPGVINCVAEITDGSVTLTTGSTAGTFSSAPAVSVKDRKLVADSDGIVCRISAHTAGQTGFTLDAAYQGDGGSGLSYTVFQDEYSLAADFLLPAQTTGFLRDCHGSYDMDLIPPNQMAAISPYPASSAAGRYCSILRDKVIRVAPYPAEARRYEYEYNYHPGSLTFDGVAATDTPLIQPAEHRIVIVHQAAAQAMVDMNDDRWEILAQAGPALLEQMKRLQRRMTKPRLFMRRQYAVGVSR